MTKLPSVMSALGQVVPDVRLRYESLDGSTRVSKVAVQSVNATSRKEASRVIIRKSMTPNRAISRDRSTMNGLSSVKDNQTHRADSQLLLCKRDQ
jgi:hypothetical protein